VWVGRACLCMGMGTERRRGAALALLALCAAIGAWVGAENAATAWVTVGAFYASLALWCLAAIATYGPRKIPKNV